MTQFLKGYAAGANDMEAGRLVTNEETVESLREQLKEAKETVVALRASMDRARELAEARLQDKPFLSDRRTLEEIARLLSGDEA